MPRGRLHRPACLGGSIMSEFIPLSVPNFGPREAELASEAITSGWVSTSGGKVTEFEEALANYVGMPRARGLQRRFQRPAPGRYGCRHYPRG